MSTPTSPASPPKRPRLSLQIKALSNSPNLRTSRTLAAAVDPKSPTAFNTLSNVYVTAIDRSSTPVLPEPVTAINLSSKQPLRLQTQGIVSGRPLQTPYAGPLPETPLTAQPMSPAVAMDVQFPSTMTATPPMSAGPMDPNQTKVFSFAPRDTAQSFPAKPTRSSPRTPYRRTTFPTASSNTKPAPYSHPRMLHSILRNSPLPPSSAKTPISPRRQSLRLQEKAARRVGYNSPLTQTITTNLYTKSHIDLLREEASPYSPNNPEEDPDMTLDLTLAYTGDETRDGGQTPGPFEEMRRRMAGLVTSTPVSPASGGVRKRKKKEKKRRWVWTLGQEEDDEEMGGAMAAIKAAQAGGTIRRSSLSSARTPTAASSMYRLDPQLDARLVTVEPPTPSVETNFSQDSVFDGAMDFTMSENTSFTSDMAERAETPGDMDVDMITPTVTRKQPFGSQDDVSGRDRLSSVDLTDSETRSRKDTPVPPDMIPDYGMTPI